MAVPSGLYRISGSLPRLPTRMTLLTLPTMLSFGLDLHEYEDVRDRAADIAERLEDGTMPCDGAWPQERIDRFNQWVAQGAQP